jgi:hypothetical protein
MQINGLDVMVDKDLLRLLCAQGQAIDAQALPATTLERARRYGILVEDRSVPADPPPFACRLDLQNVNLVPAAALAAARRLMTSGSLTVAPRIIFDAGSDSNEKWVVDGGNTANIDLWSHFGSFKPIPYRGLCPEPPACWLGMGSVFMPYWPSRLFPVERVKHIAKTGQLADLEEAELLTLILAGLVVPKSAEEPPPAGPVSESMPAAMGPVFSPLLAAAARSYFRSLRNGGYFLTDKQQVVGKRAGMYCEALSMYIQHAMVARLSELLGAPVQPSYTWVFRYQPGAALPRHRDRRACRWNVSVCVDVEAADGSDSLDWPLCFEGAAPINLAVGEAVLYSGQALAHWRDELPAETAATMLLLHYVDEGFAEGLR